MVSEERILPQGALILNPVRPWDLGAERCWNPRSTYRLSRETINLAHEMLQLLVGDRSEDNGGRAQPLSLWDASRKAASRTAGEQHKR